MIHAFYGLRPASTGLIAAAGSSVVANNLLSVAGNAGINWMGWILAGVLWLLSNKVKKTKGLHPIVFNALAAVAGIVFSLGKR